MSLLLAALVGIVSLANRSAGLSPDFLTEFVLYALSAADLTMLAALLFVLARNIIKLIVERRRALPFAHFRSKLVALLLVMTLVPAILVLIVGSELIRTNIDRWFNAPWASPDGRRSHRQRHYPVAARVVSDASGLRERSPTRHSMEPTSPPCAIVSFPKWRTAVRR
jgi:hypothetical protein